MQARFGNTRMFVLFILGCSAFGASGREPDPITIDFFDNGIRQLWQAGLKTAIRSLSGIPQRPFTPADGCDPGPDPTVAEFLLYDAFQRRLGSSIGSGVEGQSQRGVEKRSCWITSQKAQTAFEIQIVQNIGFGDDNLRSTPRQKIPDWRELMQIHHHGTYFDPQQQARVRRFGQAVDRPSRSLVQSLKREQNRDTILYFTPASNGGVLFVAAAPLSGPIKDRVKRLTWSNRQAFSGAEHDQGCQAIGGRKVQSFDHARAIIWREGSNRKLRWDC